MKDRVIGKELYRIAIRSLLKEIEVGLNLRDVGNIDVIQLNLVLHMIKDMTAIENEHRLCNYLYQTFSVKLLQFFLKHSEPTITDNNIEPIITESTITMGKV